MNQPIFGEKNVNPDNSSNPENPTNNTNRYAWSEPVAAPEVVADYPAEAATSEVDTPVTSASEALSYQTVERDTVVEENQVYENTGLNSAHQAESTHIDPTVAGLGSSIPLLAREDSDHFRVTWNEIQGKFVDDPRSAVQQADGLVTNVIDAITQTFAKEHSTLEGEWKQGNNVSTEDLRKALQRYRSFFNRLVV